MARIAAQEVERLKAEVSVVRLVEAAGITMKKSGKDMLGLCPFHEDKEPSLVVTPGKNLWHCFGCQIGGGPIDWVMKSKGVSFTHACELLKSDSSLAAAVPDMGVPATGAPPARATARTLPPPVELDASDQALLNQTIAYYHETMAQAPEAQAYLKARGLDCPELVRCFKIGYANRTLGLRLPSKDSQAGLALRTRLQELGIYRESGHEHFNGSLVVPVLDVAGNVLEVYGRKIRDDLRKGTPLHLYLPGPHRGIWNESGLIGKQEVILCEAIIDAMTFWCAGFTHVTASYGVEGFTDDHLAAFRRCGVERVLIAYDRDDAGDKAAEKLAARLIEKGFECLRVQFPRGMDANEYALKLTPAYQSLGLVLKQAVWLGRPSGGRPPALAHEGAGTQASAAAHVYEGAPVQTPTPAPVHTQAPTHAAAPAQAPTPVIVPSLAAADVASTAPAPELASSGNELALLVEDRHWRARGWRKNLSPEQMRVNLQVRRTMADGSTFYHVDTLDMYSARGRGAYIKQAAIELGLPDDVIKRDLGQVLLQLELLQDEAIRAHGKQKTTVAAMSAEEELAAMALLQAPDLVRRIVADMHACGVVGEDSNLLAGYLAAVSRKLDTPLAILIQSSSAAGKSSLMDAVLAMVPEEEKMLYSAMTGQSLFYLGETDMQHKILAIAEEEGVRQAAYALKLLQSDGELTMASTGKDEATGELTTRQYKVKGPVMLMLTTTAIDVDEELMNRCMVLAVDETHAQTKAIHTRQRERQTLAGMLANHDKTNLTKLHQNAQRLLKPVLVVNPFADQLTFIADKTRTRRDHMKYLTLIRAITLLYQHQRPVKTVEHGGQTLAYIEVNRADIALANSIAHAVLGRTLDELPPQTRRLLTELQAWVQDQASVKALPVNEFRFTRKMVRDALHWGDTQLKLHLSRLVELEYLAMQREGTLFQYGLVYDGTGDKAHLSGLINADKLVYDGERSGLNWHRSDLGVDRSGHGRANVGPMSGGGRGEKNAGFFYEEAPDLAQGGKNAVYRAGDSRSLPGPGHPVVGGTGINGHAERGPADRTRPEV
jgi:DNA primase catalytic core